MKNGHPFYLLADSNHRLNGHSNWSIEVDMEASGRGDSSQPRSCQLGYLKRYVKPDDALTDWRCRQRALVKKTSFNENVGCDCRIVREVEAQRVVVMAFNTLSSRREELVVQRERLLTGEIGRIDALLKTLDGQQDRLEERLEVLASQVPEDEEPMNTTVVDEVGSTPAITSEMDEAAFLRSQIVEIRRRKDGLYSEQAEHANTEVQIRLLLELIDEMVKNSLP